MLHIKSLDEGLPIFKALGSEIRVEIIKILLENHGMSMNELASRLNITNGALTNHIKKLEDSGIVSISTLSSGHGNIKKCSVFLDQILVDLDTREDFDNITGQMPDEKLPNTIEHKNHWLRPVVFVLPFIPRRHERSLDIHYFVCMSYSNPEKPALPPVCAVA